MMALYMPMQPSSKTPRIALRSRSFAASSSPVLFADRRERVGIEIAHMGHVMGHTSLPDPFLEPSEEIRILEILAPQSAEGNTRLDQRTVEIEKADEARPLA